MPTLFLSPAREKEHRLASGLTEDRVMNCLADAVNAYLRGNGVKVITADDGSEAEIIAESNRRKTDLHLALAAGTAPAGRKFRGIQAYYYPSSIVGRRAAQNLCDSLKTAYEDPDLVYTLPASHTPEVVKTSAPAVKMALGCREDPRDSQWLQTHVQEIGEAIARGVTNTFSLPFREVCTGPGRPLTAENAVPGAFVRVCTDGGLRLNLRAEPSMSGTVRGQIPAKQKVLLLEQPKNGWAKIRYQALEGYAGAAYLCSCTENAGPVARVDAEGGVLNLRAQPSLNAPILLRIPDQATVPVLKEEGAWAKVRYQDTEGFVLRQFIK